MNSSTQDHALVGPIAVRPYMVKAVQPVSPRHTRRVVKGWGDFVLILDTETTVDASQRLVFGSYRYCRWDSGILVCVEEGLFYADDLQADNPAGFAILERYAKTQLARVAAGFSTTLQVLSRRDFLKHVFFPAACEAKALIVGFNLPFDLSRLASAWGEGRRKYYKGFSFVLSAYQDKHTGEWKEDPYYARVGIKHIDSKRSFMGFTGGRETRKGKGWPDRFLDVRTLAFALTNIGHSLASACAAFGVTNGKQTITEHGIISDDYIEYNRRDVLATQELLQKLREEFDQHPIVLDPCRTYSPASVAKAYLQALGVNYPAQQFPNISATVLGNALSAYFGGRAEVRIRRTVVPVVYVDFLSMYPTVNSLMQLWRLLTADGIDIVECTDEVRALLDNVTLAGCFAPAFWPTLPFFAQVRARGDILPVRAQYSSETNGWNIGINPLTSDAPVWHAGPDLVGSTLLTGKAPEIVTAFRLVPRGKQEHLTPVALGGRVPIDPSTGDFFRSVIEERKRLPTRTDLSAAERTRLDQFLKVLANAGSYGVFAEMNVEDLRQDESVPVTVYGASDHFACDASAPENPGKYCCPPIASLITSGARLMLAMLERCVTDLGGVYVLCDTDSMAIVATVDGGEFPCLGGPLSAGGQSAVRTLRHTDIRTIVDRFAALSPYDRTAVPGSILKIEDENFRPDGSQRQLYAYAISAKRYALFEREGDVITVLKYSEHGLGHLLNPTDPDSEDRDWIRELWEHLIREALGLPTQEPVWPDRPAISRVGLSSPEMMRAFPDEGDYQAQVKPFNFALSAHVRPFGHPAGVDPEHFHLMAPFEKNPRKWLTLKWRDIHSGQEFRIATGHNAPYWAVGVQSYRDVVESYATHPEPKSAAQDGTECDRTTVGLLARRAVRAMGITYVGKESNRVEDVEQGLVHSWDDVLGRYHDEDSEWKNVLLPRLRAMSRSMAVELLGLSERAVSALRGGYNRPSRSTLSRLRQYIRTAKAPSLKSRASQPCPGSYRVHLGIETEPKTLALPGTLDAQRSPPLRARR